MKNIKCLLLLLITVCLSMPAFAEDEVFVPDNKSRFRVGIDALYLRPTNSDLYYVTKLTPHSPPFTDAIEENLAVEPGYEWGFYAYIGYAFPCTGNDLTLAYTYLQSTDSAFVVGNSDSFLTQDFTLLFPPTIIGTNISIFSLGSKQGKTKINLNAVDLEGGQRFTTGAYDMRMFAGLRYATVGYNLNTVIFQNTFPEIPPSDQEFNSDFKGLGPRVGINGHYCLGGSGFGLNANVSASVLVGNLDSYFSSNVNVGGLSVTNHFFKSTDDSETRVVPVLEGKLGVDYAYPLCNNEGKTSALIFEAGYQATNYFNVVDHAKVTATNVAGTAISYMNSQINTSDVGFNGIYLGIKYYA